MYARATTTITVYRGESVDEYGDPIASDTPMYTGIRASIIESKQYNKQEVTTQPRNLRWAKMRVTRGTDIQTNDRILDERTGLIWTIMNISGIQNPSVGQDLRVDLQNVG